jgi:hypothetical protein
MPTFPYFISPPISTSLTPVVCGTDTNTRDVYLSATAACYVVFNAANSGAANTAIGGASAPTTGLAVMYLPAGIPMTLIGCQLSTTYIKSVGAATAASSWYYTP